MLSARSPRVCRRRSAISSAARFVNVTAQMRAGAMLAVDIRCWILAMRQNVLPAPGPATTSTGPRGASMARRCCGSGSKFTTLDLSVHSPPMPKETAVIVGAGPIGLACAISAKRRGIDPLVIDAGALANSIVHYPIGMTFFTTPERLEIGNHPLVCAGAKATREEALKYYRGVPRADALRVRTYTKLVSAREVETRLGREPITWDRLVLATGYFDHPNHLGVPREELPHVHHYFDEAHLSYGLDVVVIGGKNSAVEAALQLFRAGARTTIVYRGSEWPKSVKYWLRPDLENRIKAGEIAARLGAQVVEITPRDVRIRGPKGEERIPADRVYPLIGFHPDLELFRKIGIAFDAESGRPRIDPETLETSVAGVHVAGSVIAGNKISEVFIENGRFDGEKIFRSESGRPRIDPETLETSVAGVHVAGSVIAGNKISEIFIENGRFDGEKIFGSPAERAKAGELYQGIRRETGE